MTATLAPTDAGSSLLTSDMLRRFDERAPGYDRDTRFFNEDFEEFRESGYLAISPTSSSGR